MKLITLTTLAALATSCVVLPIKPDYDDPDYEAKERAGAKAWADRRTIPDPAR